MLAVLQFKKRRKKRLDALNKPEIIEIPQKLKGDEFILKEEVIAKIDIKELMKMVRGSLGCMLRDNR